MSTKNSKRILEVKIIHMADKDPDTSYLEKGDERYRTFHAGLWDFMGVLAEAQIGVPQNFVKGSKVDSGVYITQRISSGGLWGIESDSDKSHIASIEGEQLSELKDQLKALGFSSRAIATAFKDVKRVNE